ncbi:MAG: FG-GAP-like repeat-containing protein, partial [Bacteroidota bacterium]
RPQLADLDADGDVDLLVLDEGGALLHFENTAAPGQPAAFAWRSDDFAGLSALGGVGAWYRLGDLDGDGDLDLLATSDDGPNRARLLLNTGTAQAPAFTLAADPLADTDGNPIRAETTNLPGLADLDGDGDLDYFAGTADLGTVFHYRHDGVGPDGVPRFTLATEQFADIVIFESDPTCPSDLHPPNSLPQSDSRANSSVGRGPSAEGIPAWAPPLQAASSGLHGQNAIAFADVDGDADQDFFWGDFFTVSLLYFENEGTPAAPSLVLASEVYPEDEPLSSGGYSVPSFEDTDGDGDLDLLVGIAGGLCSQPKNLAANLFFFENIGSTTAPRYTERTDQLLPSFDAGRRTVPALGDLDGDGDLDAIVGNDEDFRFSPSRAVLRRLENTGSPTEPRWQEADNDFLTLDLGISANAYTPALADLTGDGQLDLVVGEFGRALFLFRRTDRPLTDPESFVEATPNPFADLAIGQRPAPALGDLDGDGDADLVVGEFNGRLRFFRNTGTAQAAAFTLETDRFLDADVGSFSRPHLADLDGDGDLDLLVGSNEGPIQLYRNDGTPQAFAFTEAGLIPAARDGTAPALGDLDGDGDPDLVSGALGGGLLFFENADTTDTVPPPTPTVLRFEAFPNPTTGATRFRIDVPPDIGADADILLTVYDVLGRLVFEARVPPTSAAPLFWDGTDATGRAVAGGRYVAVLRAGSERLATRAVTRLPRTQ